MQLSANNKALRKNTKLFVVCGGRKFGENLLFFHRLVDVKLYSVIIKACVVILFYDIQCRNLKTCHMIRIIRHFSFHRVYVRWNSKTIKVEFS